MLEHPVATPARQPSAVEWAEAVEEAQEIHVHVVETVADLRDNLWLLAEWLWEANEKLIWLKLGHDTKGEWLAQPEINVKPRTFERLVRCWRETVVMRHVERPALAGLDTSKVDLVLTSVTRARVPLVDALSDAKVLGWHDLREKYLGIPSPLDPPALAGNSTELVEIDDPELAFEDRLDGLRAAIEELDEVIDSGQPYPRVHRDTCVTARVELQKLTDELQENGNGDTE